MFKSAVVLLVGLLLLGGLSGAALAQEEDAPVEPGPWKMQGVVGLNLTQSAFSNNWNGGDAGTAAWVATADFKAERQLSYSFNLTNQLQLSYGQTSTQKDDPDDAGKKVWSRPEKTTDLILFESVGRLTKNWFVDPYLSFRLDSQFRDQSDPLGELSFNPVKLSETAGVAHMFHKTEDAEIISRVGFGFRQTISRAYVDLLGEETERFTTSDGGFEWQTTATYPLFDKRVAYTGKLLVFWPLFYDKSSALKEFDGIALDVFPNRDLVQDYWKSPDINWQNTFSAQITKIISVNLYVQFIYDKFDAATDVNTDIDVNDADAVALLLREVDGSIRKAGQFKQTLALGITYRLF